MAQRGMRAVGKAHVAAHGRPCVSLGARGGARATGWVARHLVSEPRERLASLRLRASADDEGTSGDDDFEERLAKLRAAKGTTGRGQGGTKNKAKEESGEQGAAKKMTVKRKAYDYTGETVFFESRPSAGDLAVNVALGATLLWLPLTFAALGRFAWVNYKVTDKRVSVSNTSPIGKEEEKQTDVAYEEISEVVAIGRGLGLWGDMVIKLKDGSKCEIRSIDKWQEVKAYIEERAKAVSSDPSVVTVEAEPMGFS